MADTEYDVTVTLDESVNADVGSTQIEGGLSIDETFLSLSAESPDDIIVDANVNTTEALEVTAEENTGGTDDHRKLYHRDALNQHPMTAITGSTSSRTLADEISTINTTLGVHTTNITTATNAAGVANTNATYAKDGLNTLTPIVGSLETDMVDVQDNANDIARDLELEVQNRMTSSLINRGVASVDEEHGIISLFNSGNKLELRGDSMVFSRSGNPTAYIMSGYNTSLLKSDNARFTYIYMRDPNGVGCMSWIAASTGHITLKRY